MPKRRARPKLVLGKVYMLVDGQKVEIDPYQTDFPTRCKKVILEALTGNKYEVVSEEND